MFKDYIAALRPWSFSASFTPVILGAMLAYKSTGDFDILVLLSTIVCAVAVHASGNVINTYMDYIHGVDTKSSEDRTLVDHVLTIKQVQSLGMITYSIACVGYLLVSCTSQAKYQHIALLFFGGMSSSFLYTGGFGLKYVALGDVAIILSFGPLIVMFSYLTQTGLISAIPLFYAVPLALNTEAILHSNNTRDVRNDKRAGIVTLAILLGPMLSYLLYVFLLFMPYVIFYTIAFNYTRWMYIPILTIVQALNLERSFRRGDLFKLPHKVAELNLMLGVLYVFACFMADGADLPKLQS